MQKTPKRMGITPKRMGMNKVKRKQLLTITGKLVVSNKIVRFEGGGGQEFA